MKGIISFLSPNRRKCFRINEKICRKNPVFSGKKKQQIQKTGKKKYLSLIFVVNCAIKLYLWEILQLISVVK